MASDVIAQLKQIRLFSELSRDQLQAVAALIHRERYRAGRLVCRQGERGRRFYWVESGELRVLHIDPDGIEQEVARLGPGGFFGETSLLLGEPHDATVEAVQDTTLLYLNKEDFDQLVDERPSILGALQMSSEVKRRRRAPRFDWQEPDEVVVFILHKHNVVLFRGLILPGLLLLLILAGYWYFRLMSLPALILGGLLASVPSLFALYRIVDHFNDKYILTNKRVMHDEYIWLIRESRVGAPLYNIQNIQVMRQGLLAQFFDFGDLLIETAGEPGGVVTFRQIPNPTERQQAIFEQMRRVEAQARAEERADIRDALQRRFGEGSPEERSPEPEEETPERRFKLSLPSWLRAPLRFFRYFVPALRQEEGDTITWRKHWIALTRPIALPTMLILLSTLVAALMLGQDPGNVPSVLAVYGTLLIFLLPWWLWVFEDWRNDVYQVTSTRIIDVEILPFALREERREASLGRIQNVNLRVPSLWGRLLGYGSVVIETAGAGAFTFDYVKNPRRVQNEIFRRMEAFEARERQQEARRRRDELLDWFTTYDQMRHPNASRRGTGPVLPGAPQQEGGAEGRKAQDADPRRSSQQQDR